MLTIGCHLSSSRGYLAMGKEAVKINANTFQFFTRNPRGGKAKDIDPEDVAAFLAFAREHGISRILAHAPYTLNACSADEKIRDFARRTMADDLLRMEYTPGNCYNFHPGGYDIANHLDEVLTEFDRVIGLNRLCALHLNDSLNPLGAHKDRHARIGEGHIGQEALIRVVQHPALKDLPFYLETPNELDGYAKEISLMREYAK